MGKGHLSLGKTILTVQPGRGREGSFVSRKTVEPGRGGEGSSVSRNNDSNCRTREKKREGGHLSLGTIILGGGRGSHKLLLMNEIIQNFFLL